MNFEPTTSIWFCKTGIDEHNKVICTAPAQIPQVITRSGNVIGQTTANSWQRDATGFQIRVDHSDIDYYDLLFCDTVLYANEEGSNRLYIVGNITNVEWKNPDCSFVSYKIDWFMTFGWRIDWTHCYAFVEREHVCDDWSAEDGNPLFSNMGPDEGINVNPDTPIFSWHKSYALEAVLINSPYDDSGKAVFEGRNQGGLYTSIQSKVCLSTVANNYFNAIAENKEASINNIVSVQGIPQHWETAATGNAGEHNEEDFQIPAVNNTPFGKGAYRNAKCYSSPFMNIRLFSSEGDVKDFTPQWFGNDIDEYTIKTRVGFAGGMFGGAQCTFFHKNGQFDWMVWNDFIVALTQLPKCMWTADGYTDWDAINHSSVVWNVIKGMVKGGYNIAGGLLVTAAGMAQANIPDTISGVEQIAQGIGGVFDTAVNYETTINQHKATGATVSGGGSFSSIMDVSTGGWGFKAIYYTTQQYIMNNVDSYFDRYGYRINKLKRIVPNARPYWTFIKTKECHLEANAGAGFIPNRELEAIFNNGVTIWNRRQYIGGYDIGDYSKAAENKGILGADIEL